ncbi:MAG: CpXC domain-containing protein [Nitrospiraceae bacterium]|nr:CpXC domain-containing protein [Nitrospiraceae bacterium]
MVSPLYNQAEAFSRETFQCGNCDKDFSATVITWVDVSKTPQARQALLQWQFNVIQCAHCGCRHFSETPFFYEDFEQGLLLAVFPRIPEKRGEVEKSIREKYGYYPVLEFFYDMTQIWMLLYLQEHYKGNANLRSLSRLGTGEERIRKMLGFLKEDPLMIDIREALTESFLDEAANERLLELLGLAIYTLEEMLPWPRDRRCVCGTDLAEGLTCCNNRISLGGHERLLSKHYVIYCPICGEALSGASCEQCGRVYTWKLGIVPTGKPDEKFGTHGPSSSQHDTTHIDERVP